MYKPVKIPVDADSKEYQKLLRVVRDIRSRTVKEIQAQASKFNIEMDQSDMDILNGIASTESAVEAALTNSSLSGTTKATLISQMSPA